MATIVVDRSHHGALPISGGDAITCEESRSVARVFNRGATAVYVRIGNTTPSASGANDGDLIVPPNSQRDFPVTDPVEIRLNGALALAYSVELY